MFKIIFLFSFLQVFLLLGKNYDYSSNIYQEYLNKAYLNYDKSGSSESISVIYKLYDYNKNFSNLNKILNCKKNTCLKNKRSQSYLELKIKHLFNTNKYEELVKLKEGYVKNYYIAYSKYCKKPKKSDYVKYDYSQNPDFNINVNDVFNIIDIGCIYLKDKKIEKYDVKYANNIINPVFKTKSKFIVSNYYILLKYQDKYDKIINNKEKYEFINSIKDEIIKDYFELKYYQEIDSELEYQKKINSLKKFDVFLTLPFLIEKLKQNNHLEYKKLINELYQNNKDNLGILLFYEDDFIQNNLQLDALNNYFLGNNFHVIKMIENFKKDDYKTAIKNMLNLLKLYPYSASIYLQLISWNDFFKDNENFIDIKKLYPFSQSNKLILYQIIKLSIGELFKNPSPLLKIKSLSEVKYLYGLFFKQNEFINTDFFKKELENLSAKELENENKILKITKTIEIDKNMNYSVKLKEAIRFANLNISDLFYEILYIDGEEFVEIKNAYIFKENGDFIKIKDYDSLIPYEYDGLYSDMRILKFNLKDLIKKGDVFYVDYKITSTDKRNYFNNKISILDNIKPTSDIIYYKYSIKYPKSVKFKVAYNNNLLKKEELVEEEYNTLIFTAQNLKQFIEEPYYYFSYKEEAYISISNFLNWNEVKEWFKKIIFDKSYELSDKNKTFFKQLVSENNLKEKEDIIKFFYNYILDNIHYIGIELGIHSYKPYPPNVVFENKYGDCKDRVILFYHIMKLFDINVDFVLVASSNSGIYNFEIPSYSYFNHAIVYIPSINKFLDLTDKNTPYSYLPISDINSKILILDKEKNIEILKVKNRDKIIKEFIYTKIKNDVKVNHIESYYGNTLTSDLKIDFKLLDSFVYERYINKYYANNVDFKSYKSENEVRSEVKVFNFEYILKNMVNNNVAIIKLFQDDDLFESKFTPNNIRVNSFLFITKFNYEYKFKFNNLNKIYNFNNKIIDNTFFKAMLIFKDGTIKFNFEMKVNKISAQENNNFKIKLKELDELLQKKYYLEVK